MMTSDFFGIKACSGTIGSFPLDQGGILQIAQFTTLLNQIGWVHHHLPNTDGYKVEYTFTGFKKNKSEIVG